MENKNEASLDEARKRINEIDSEMARLFTERMKAAGCIAEYKRKNALPILDGKREAEVIARNLALVEEEYKSYYTDFLKNNMALSRAYQASLTGVSEGSTLRMNLGEDSYDITVGRGLLSRAGEYFNLDRKVFIVTDEGVPAEYAKAVAGSAREYKIATVRMGEGSKSPETYTELLRMMCDFGMTRSDCAVAVGGGVVGDLTGFLSASYMRGIDFYNVPTTLLSQVDSSIGGKTAINLGGIKNIVGAFHQPRGVLVDLDTLKTLDKRQLSNGLAEAVKMSLTSNAELFEFFENEEITDDSLERIVTDSLKIKKRVVEQDEREGGLRKILNFGHTFGHAVEAEEEMRGFYHGECVAIGMTVTSSDEVRERLIRVLSKLGLPTEYKGDIDKALSFISHDKKCEGDGVSVIFVDAPGSFRIEKITTEAFCELVRKRI